MTIEKITYWLVLLMPISLAIDPNTAGEANFTALSLMGGFYLIADKDRRYTKENWFKAFLTLVVYMLVRSFFAPDISMSLGIVIQVARFLLFLIAMQYGLKGENHNQILYVLVGATLFLVVEGYAQYFTGQDLIFGRKLIDEGYYHRITGPYKRMIYGEIVTKFAAPMIAMGMFYLKNKKVISVGYLFAGLLAFVIVCLSGERAALITFCLGVLVVIFASYNMFSYKGLISLGVGSVSITGILIALCYVYPKVLARQFHSVIDIAANYSQSIYGKLWIAGLKIGAAHPIFGAGGNHFKKYYCQYLDGTACLYKKPHGIYIEFFCDFGLVGLGMFLYLIYCFGIKIFGFYKIHKNRRVINFLLLGICVSVLQPLWPLPIRSLYRTWVAFPFWFMIGWALNITETVKCEKK